MKPAPGDPVKFFDALVKADGDEAVKAIVSRHLENAKRAVDVRTHHRIGRLYTEIQEWLMDGGPIDDPMRRSLKTFLDEMSPLARVERYDFYPIDRVPAATSTARPYEEVFYRDETASFAVGPTSGNPDNEISLHSGFVTGNPHTGLFTSMGSVGNGRTTMTSGPVIKFETTAPSDIYVRVEAVVDYRFAFNAYANAKFVPAQKLPYDSMMQTIVDLKVFSEALEKSGPYHLMPLGVGGNYAATIRSVGLFPEGLPSGSVQAGERHAGTQLQGGEFSVPVKLTDWVSLPAAARCKITLRCSADTQSVGPRNGKWNPYLCYAETSAAFFIPKIEVRIWT